ncbi:winged helix-turn-helix domain-containing protein [Bosea minatitlanensis]|uniref:Winged helix-turn-helix domain-containing protein n=1 Tax=Bosea minatitlanensis TaxID=128782 RepID=A0ABW0EYE2_9HYPH|nr:winged helix-turn-helix domain-containing protein [Bosea minatitlanensis]MCT4491779.1 helix-turn-helix domain-containing protein [Bosea minatitlanensis]
MDQFARLEALEAENGRLRDRVAELEDALGFTIDMPVYLGLSQTEARLFGALMRRPVWSREQLMVALYSHRPDEPPEIKIVDVFICKIRRKLKPLGIEIENLWGQGYRLAPAMRDRALAIIQQRAGQ